MFKFNNEIPEFVVEAVKTCWGLFSDGNDNSYEVGIKMESECEFEINDDNDKAILNWFEQFEGLLFSYRGIDIRIELKDDYTDEEYFYLNMTWVEPNWLEMNEKGIY